MSGNNKYLIRTVYNAMSVLKLFTQEQPRWRISEMARELNLNVSHVKRIVKTLTEEGFLQRTSDRRYELGLAVLSLCGVITSTMEIHKEAKPILEEVVEITQEAVHLGILEGIDTVYLNKMDGPHPVRLVTYTGKKLPSYCTGCGKVLLAYKSKKGRAELLQLIEHYGIESLGPNTVRSVEELKKQLDGIKAQGYAVCIDEVHEGVISIAAPVFDYTEQVVAAVSVTGPTHRLGNHDAIMKLTKIIREAAQKISERLGYPVRTER